MSHVQVVAAALGAKVSATGLKQNQGKYVQSGTGPAYWGPGDEVTFLITGEETGGAVFMSEMSVPPEGGPPPHIHHREDEAFFVLEGEITFTLADRKVAAKPGSFIQGPRGIPHAFKNESQAPARMLILVTPPGFEKFMAEFAQPVASFDSPPLPVTPADIQKLLAVAPRYGIEILPPSGSAHAEES